MNRRYLFLALLALTGCKPKLTQQQKNQMRFNAGAADLAKAEGGTTDTLSNTSSDSLAPAEVATGAPRLLAITVDDNSVSAPDSVITGPFEVRLTNHGTYIHEVRFLRLSGTTHHDALAYIQNKGELPRGLGTYGGAGPVEPGKSLTIIEALPAGDYILVDRGISPPGNKYWFTRGLVRGMIVRGVFHGIFQPAQLAADASVLTSDGIWRFGVALTTSKNRSLLVEGRARRNDLVRGDMVIMFEHNGGGGHDAVIMRAAEPGMMKQYALWQMGAIPKPPEIVGGIPGLYFRMKVYMKLHLESGPYIIFCPSPSGLYNHFDFGQFAQFVVR